jgi:2-dehydro-3-deoxyphosphogluconate aldolase/(4S)-4-hydroxy-2-oxoglutarate aldolase
MHPAAQHLVDDGLIAVLRLGDTEAVLPVAEALVAGGVTVLEVTATVPRADEALTQLRAHLGDDVLLGAGSVLDASTARRMVDAGAAFVVSPVSASGVMTTSQEAGAAVVPGTFSPTEMQAAHEAGADLIKLFPAHTLGPEYLSSVLAPLPHLDVVPTGGVGPETVGDWFEAGAAAVAAGGALIDDRAITEARYDAVTDRARTMRERIDATR